MFKKLVSTVLAVSISTSAFAAQDIYLTFNNGKTAVYKNLPDTVDNTDFEFMLVRDHGMSLSDVDPNRSKVVSSTVEQPSQSGMPASSTDEKFCSSNLCKVAVGILIIGAAYYAIKATGPAQAAACTYSWQVAKDGSRCGARASSVRPGGR